MRKINKYSIILLLQFVVGISISQTREIDSLKQIIKNSKEDTNKVNTLINLCKESLNNDLYDTAYRYSLISQNLAKKIDYKKGLSSAYSLIANIYYHHGNYHKSLEFNLEALRIREQVGDVRGIANSYNNIGNVYFRLNVFAEALKNHFAALEIREKLKDSLNLGYSYNNIGNVYRLQGKLEEALKSHFAGLKIKQLLQDKKEIAYSLNNIGIIYTDLKNYNEAIKYHTQALAISKGINSLENMEISYFNLSKTYLKLKDYATAEHYAFIALKMAEDIGDIETIIDANMLLSILYEQTSDFKKSLNYYHKFISIRDSIYNEENLKNTVQTQLQFDFEKKEMIVKKEQEERDIEAKAESKKQKWILILVSCILMLVIVFAVITYRGYLNKQKAFKIISQQKLEVEKQSKIIEQTNAELEQLSIVASKTDNIVLVLNPEGDIEYVNESFQKLNRISLKEILEKKLNIFNSSNNSKIKSIVEEAVKNKRSVKYESINKKNPENIVWEASTLTPIFDDSGKLKKIIIIDSDITEAKQQQKIIEEKNKDITSSIKYAKRIQQAILPSLEAIKEKFPDSFILYKPKDIVAGDFYWVSDAVTKHQESFMMVAVADCTGHGVPGALMSVIGNNFLRICEREPTVNRPSEALDFINLGISKTLRQEYSKSTIQDGMDMVFVAIDYSAMLLHFAGAKNSIYIVRDGVLTEYKGDKHPIGAYVGEEMKKFTNHSIPVQKGDCVYLFTDGYADQFGGPEGKKFMYSRFKKTLSANSHLSMDEQHNILVKEFEDWKADDEQVDDVCVFGCRI